LIQANFSDDAFRNTGSNCGIIANRLMPAHSEGKLPRKSSEEISSLNGLRAISIILVIVGHAVGSGEGRTFGYKFLLEHGGLGVRVFFIISGYLITTLLLRERARFGWISLKLFYIRRALRILPAFYVFVVCIVILERLGLFSLPAHNLIYVLTYTVNFISNVPWWTAHLWSLSVEEQFYLLWPLALRFLSTRTCVTLALLAIMAGILIRALFIITSIQLIGEVNLQVLPIKFYYTAFPFVSGAVAMGCLLAIAEPKIKKTFQSHRIFWGPVGLAAIPLVMLLDVFEMGTLNLFLRIGADSLLTYLVARFVYEPGDYFGRLLNSRLMVFVGKLSYSLYLWQQLFFHHYANWLALEFNRYRSRGLRILLSS
jgi:peptidoglycan/LPS O-acetylase OafA/YrhL